MHLRAVATVSLLVAVIPAQDRRQQIGAVTPVLAAHDKNGDGRLDREERDAARKTLQESGMLRQRSWLRMFSRTSVDPPLPVPAEDRIRPSAVVPVKGPLYAPKLLRTIFLDFPRDDWFEELRAFYKTDVDLPAKMTVDGRVIEGVGVRFRGSSSYLMVGGSLKKSFNISVDFTDKKADLYGASTLNLLNGNQDESFVREILFAHVARNYIPVPRVNYVKLVINGANWGVYQNAEQYNRDFLAGYFGRRGGVRWKVQRNQRGVGALTYQGEDRKAYWAYELKTRNRRDPKQDDAAWQRLIHLCRTLHDAKAGELTKVLPPILDVDSVLWFCALENAFLPNDGYVRQGYDYRIFEDTKGRFCLVSHDNNEILQTPRRMRSGGGTSIEASPLRNANLRSRPVLNRLMEVPEWRMRYLAHMRTIVREWLSWETLGPVAHGYHALIADELRQDTKKLFTSSAIRKSLERGRGGRWPLKKLIETRRQHILAHATMQGPWPEITAVKHRLDRSQGRRLHVEATVQGVDMPQVILYYGLGRRPRYTAMALTAGSDGVYRGATPDLGKKKRVRFYVEARGAKATAFHPTAAESRPLTDR